MKALTMRLFRSPGRKNIRREVEEELRFHVELLRREHVRRGMSPDEAGEAALKRFGDVEQIRDQCVEISRRSHPLVSALKSFLVLVFLAGMLVCALSTDFNVRRVGEVLVLVAVLSRLLLYAHGLSRSSSLPKRRNTMAADF